MTQAILVTHASRFGSTGEVAEAIAETLREAAYKVDCQPMAETHGFDGYQAVVLGSAVNYANWILEAVDFVRDNQEPLAHLPVALFTVHIRNLDNNPESRLERLAYLDEVRPYLSPAAEGFFAGRFNRHAAKELMPGWAAMFVPSIDLRKWKKVRSWARRLPEALFQPLSVS